MPNPVDLSHLDPESLQKFIDDKSGGVAAFIDALAALSTDTHPTDGTLPLVSMTTLVSALANPAQLFMKGGLQLGNLALSDGKADGPLTATGLLAYIQASANSFKTVVNDQSKLFDDIKLNLGTTITSMKDAQQASLDKVDGQKFLNDFHNVEADLSPKTTKTA
ncbi:type VII secretion system-associated protein [Streptomyces sp. NPDC014735]|uniref:type VII secretion system-associated protein n=1 Tax=unclassified Streptomyces TaxID=2593676 RepID=UPI0036FA4FDF